jgi:hypothetical protein
MRQANAILLLFLYLSASTEVHEILRIPILFAHFQEHSSGDLHISFRDFIIIHYLGDAKPGGDYGRDQQLPFKETHFGEFAIFIAVLPDTSEEPGPPAHQSVSKDFYEPALDFFVFQPPIWQPPRS